MMKIKERLQILKENYSIATNKNPKRAVLTLILMLNIFLILGGAVIISLLAPKSLQHRGFLPSIYYTINLILDPGNIALVVEDIGEAGVACIAVCITVIVLGMIIFTGSVIGYVTNYISDFIESANTGIRALRISGHTVILNWNSRASEIVNDMLYSDEAEKVVILVSSDREKVEQEIRDRIADTLEKEKEHLLQAAKSFGLTGVAARSYVSANCTRNRLTIIVREGNVYSTQKLNDISIRLAKAIIILGDEESTESRLCKMPEQTAWNESGNSELIKTLIQVSELTGGENSWNNQKVIIEVEDEWTLYLVNRIINHKENQGKSYIVPVSVDQLLGQILSQFSIMPELNMVYDELFSNKGAAFYSLDYEIGRTDDEHIRDYLSDHLEAIPMTSFQSKGGRHFYYMANNVNSLKYEKKTSHPSGISVEINPDFWMEKRNIIILGHNSKIRSIINGFNSFRKEWNFIREQDIELYGSEEILDVEVINSKKNLDKLKMLEDVPYVRYVVAADVYDREIIETAINQYISAHKGKISILVLSDDTDAQHEQDSDVMTYLIYLRDIIHRRCGRDPEFDQSRVDVIYEIQDPKNYDVIRSYSSKNVIISNRYISRMVTQISEKEEMFEFYNDILHYDEDLTNGYESKELYIKTAGRFYSKLPGPCTADELIRATYEASPVGNRSILLGYISPEKDMILFKGDQTMIKVELKGEDKLIIFSNH